MRSVVLGLGFLLALPLPGTAQTGTAQTEEDPPAEARPGVGQLRVELSPTVVTVGDRVEARITLVWMGQEPTAGPRFPPWQGTWGGAEVLSASQVEAVLDQSSRRIYRQTLTLTAFDTGEVRLPTLTVAVPLAAGTVEVSSGDAKSFAVETVLPDGEGDGAELAPREAAPLLALRPGQRFLWTAGGLGGLGLLIAWLLARRLGRPGAPAAALPLLEPLEELLQHLQQLDPAAIEPTHTGLSLGLRHFLGRSLAFPAVESTTSEIQRRMRPTAIPAALARQTVSLLRDCDQVKFARVSVDEKLTADRLTVALELAREIDDELDPEAPEAEAAAR